MSACCRQCANQAAQRTAALSYYVRRQRRVPLRGYRGLRGLGQTNDIPAGSVLNYVASYNAASASSIIPGSTSSLGPLAVINAIKNNLQQQWGIIVTASNYGASLAQFSYSIALTLQTMQPYGAIADIQSIVDGAFYNVAGISGVVSNISLQTLASPGTNVATAPIGQPVPAVSPSVLTATIPGTSFDFASFFSSNWIWIAAAVIAGVAVEELI